MVRDLNNLHIDELDDFYNNLSEVQKMIFNINGGGGASGIWTDIISASAGDTTVTILDDRITNDSVIDVYSQTVSGLNVPFKSITVTIGQIVIDFGTDGLLENTEFKVWIR